LRISLIIECRRLSGCQREKNKPCSNLSCAMAARTGVEPEYLPPVRRAPTQWLRSRKVCSARRTDFGVFRHLIPAMANERSCRHASANNDKWNANDCTNYGPAKYQAD